MVILNHALLSTFIKVKAWRWFDSIGVVNCHCLSSFHSYSIIAWGIEMKNISE